VQRSVGRPLRSVHGLILCIFEPNLGDIQRQKTYHVFDYTDHRSCFRPLLLPKTTGETVLLVRRISQNMGGLSGPFIIPPEADARRRGINLHHITNVEKCDGKRGITGEARRPRRRLRANDVTVDRNVKSEGKILSRSSAVVQESKERIYRDRRLAWEQLPAMRLAPPELVPEYREEEEGDHPQWQVAPAERERSIHPVPECAPGSDVNSKLAC
jgi:hypothetical protein